jgi:hypothetical protein
VQIAARIRELITDTGLASRLVESGLAQANRFSWAAAAKGTLASYRRALTRSGNNGATEMPQTGAGSGVVD